MHMDARGRTWLLWSAHASAGLRLAMPLEYSRSICVARGVSAGQDYVTLRSGSRRYLREQQARRLSSW